MRILVVVLILGLAAGAAVASLDASQSSTSGHASRGTAEITIPSPAQGIAAAAVQACKADFGAADAAVSEYEAEHGQPPASITDVQSYLRDPLNAPQYHYSITIAAGHRGQLEVATPAHPASPGSGNCAYAGE